MHLKVLLSAPGDQSAEVAAAMEAIAELHELLEHHGHSLEVVNWSKNIVTGRSSRGQQVVNDQVSDCNALIAIFGLRFGSPTGHYDSGTEEEIINFLEARPTNSTTFDVHVFFNSSPVSNPLSIDPKQLEKVLAFRKQLQDRGLLITQFSTIDRLKQLVRTGLNLLIAQNKPLSPGSADPLSEFEDLGSLDAIEEGNRNMLLAADSIARIGHAMELGNKRTQKLNDENIGSASPESAKRRWIADLATTLNELNLKIYPEAEVFESAWNRAYAMLHLGLSIESEDAKAIGVEPDYADLKDSVQSALSNLREMKSSIGSLRTSISNLPRLTKELKASKRAVISTLERLDSSLISIDDDFGSLQQLL